MNATITATLNRLEELAASIPALAEIALDHGLITALEVSDPLTPVDTGALRGNRVTERGDGFRTIIWPQHYAVYQNFGTTHGVPATHFATIGGHAGLEAMDARLKAWGR